MQAGDEGTAAASQDLEVEARYDALLSQVHLGFEVVSVPMIGYRAVLWREGVVRLSGKGVVDLVVVTVAIIHRLCLPHSYAAASHHQLPLGIEAQHRLLVGVARHVSKNPDRTLPPAPRV